MNDKVSHLAIKKSELEEVRKKSLCLVYEIPENDWGRKVPGEAWAAKEEMAHRPKEHFDEHAPHLCNKLGIGREGKR